MLVGGRVKDDGRLLLREKRIHLHLVVNVDHQRHADRRVHLAVDLVKHVLAALDHQHLRRTRRRHLTDDFGADRTARPRHHHRPARQERPRDRIVEARLVTRQELLVTHARHPVDAPEDADADDADRAEEEGHDRDRVGRTDVRHRHVRQEKAHRRQHRARQGHRPDVARQLASARPPPRQTVAPAGDQRREMDDTDHHETLRRRPPAPLRRLEVKTKRKRAQVGKPQHGGVDDKPDGPRRQELHPGHPAPPPPDTLAFKSHLIDYTINGEAVSRT